MKIKKIAIVLCLVALLLTSCTNSKKEETANSLASVESSVSVAELSSEEETPKTGDAELDSFIDKLRTGKPESNAIIWQNGTDEKVRLKITSKLFNDIADTLSQEPATIIDGVKSGKVYSDAGAIIQFSDNGSDYIGYSINMDLLSENEENEANSGKLQAIFSNGEKRIYRVYEAETYNKLAEVLQSNVYTDEIKIEGNFIPVESTFLKDNNINVLKSFELEDSMLFLWNKENPDGSVLCLEVIDKVSGKSLYSKDDIGDLKQIESYRYKDYDYRLNYADRVEYYSSKDSKLTETFKLPTDLVSSIIGGEDLFEHSSFDVNLEKDMITYSTEDGIYLSKANGSDSKLILPNKDISGLITEDMEIPEYEDKQLKYLAPMVMDNGNKIVSTFYLLTNGNYDSFPIGVTIYDVASGNSTSKTGLAWLSSAANRLDDTHVNYLGDNGYIVLDINSNKENTIDFDYRESVTYDYKTGAKVKNFVDEDGYEVNELVLYKIDNPDEKNTILTLRNEYMRVDEMSENFALCSYHDISGKWNFILVPLV